MYGFIFMSILTYIHKHTHTHLCAPAHVYLYLCHMIICIERDLGHFWRIRGRILPTQIQCYDIWMQDPLRWSWSTLFQVTKNKKIMYFKYFLPIHQVGAKWMAENSIFLRFTSLDIKILDPTISSWFKHLKTLTLIFIRFQIFYTIKVTNSLCHWPFEPTWWMGKKYLKYLIFDF